MYKSKTNQNADLDLSPFIALFAVLTCILLMTSSWVEILGLQVNIHSIKEQEVNEESFDSKSHIYLSVLVTKKSITIKENEKISYQFNHIKNKIDHQKLIKIVQKIKKSFPNKKDIILQTENQIEYQKLVDVFSILTQFGFANVGIDAGDL